MPKAMLMIFLAVCLCGCARSTPSNYYILEGPAPQPEARQTPVKSLRIAQVYVPAYLNRNNIVSRVPGETKLILAEFHLWAEPLGAGVSRILEEILTQPLLEAGVSVLAAGTDSPGDYVLTVDLLRLDANFNEKAVLEGRWALYDRDERAILRGMFAEEEQVAGADYNLLVAAESKLVRAFGAHLANELKTVMRR